MAQHAWGIDIGDGTLKAVRVRKRPSGFDIVRAVRIPYFDPFISRKPLSAPIERRAVAALIQFKNTAKVPDGDIVAIGYPSFTTIESHLAPPNVGKDELERMVQFEVAELTSLPLDELSIAFKTRKGRSHDRCSVQVLAAVKNELESFEDQINEVGLPCDRLVSSAGSLFDFLKTVHSGPSECIVISPGLAATSFLILQRNAYWTRTAPMRLPLPPGEGADMAKDRIELFADELGNEAEKFLESSPLKKGRAPKKIFVTGEGARVPALLNILDSRMPLPVGILSTDSNLTIDRDKYSLPPASVVASMSKAIGLAVGSLTEKSPLISLAQADPKRLLLRKLPAFTWLAFLFFFAVAGIAGIESYCGREQKSLENRFGSLKAFDLLDEASALKSEIGIIENELARMERAVTESRVAIIPGRIINRMEDKSIRGKFGLFHIVEIVIDNQNPDEKMMSAIVATRLSDGEEISREIDRIFGPFLLKPNESLSGPYPSGEVNPPPGESPLVHYRVKGLMKRPR